MKTTAGQKVKIGIFTAVGIAILVIGIFIIGSRKNMFSDTFSIYGTFRNVGGLMVGNNVRFAGINVGTVEEIVIENDTMVHVDMRLQSRLKAFLRSDAVASIGSDGLMGDKLVMIAPGQASTEMLKDGSRIVTVNPIDFDKIIGRIANVATNAEVITASLASISSQISGGKGSLGKLIYTDDLQKGLVGTVNSAKETMESAHDAIKSVKKGTEGFSENMEALKHNVLLRGYYKKKAKAKEAAANGTAPATDPQNADNAQPAPNSAAQPHKETRAERRLRKKSDKNSGGPNDSL